MASNFDHGFLEEIVALLRPLDPEKVILFGSFVWGEPSESSDIDLFIVKTSEPHKVRGISLDAMRRLRPLIFKYHKGFDVLVDDPSRIRGRIEQLHDQFYRMIQEKGVTLYAKQDLRP
jgi:predicted nucleotidyltransferase